MKYETSLSTPYPDIVVDFPSYSDAKCLLESYSGRISECTSIMTYVYQHYILKEDYPDIADLMLGVAMTEMHHHELLGLAIHKNAGDPVIGGMRAFWNGSYVHYSKNIKTLLKRNIESEKAAISDYLSAIRCVKNESVQQLLQRIIMDEELHITLFENALATL